MSVLSGGRNWDRTSDPSLVRRVITVAGRGWTWPDMASASHDCGWTWPGVAWCRWLLAPRLAPPFVSAANLQQA